MISQQTTFVTATALCSRGGNRLRNGRSHKLQLHGLARAEHATHHGANIPQSRPQVNQELPESLSEVGRDIEF